MNEPSKHRSKVQSTTTHRHRLGLPGKGKSKLTEVLAREGIITPPLTRQDIRFGHGTAVIDSHSGDPPEGWSESETAPYGTSETADLPESEVDSTNDTEEDNE